MENLVVFITHSQEEIEKLAYQTSTLNYHRYFITIGYTVNSDAKYFRETDSYLEIIELDTNNLEILKRLVLVYSPPNYEHIVIYVMNNIISLIELQTAFHDLLNGKLTDKDYLFSLSRMGFVYENKNTESVTNIDIDFSEIINNAMSEIPISFSDLKIVLKELLPENSYILDQSCIHMPNELKNIVLEYNKNNFKTKMTVFYNDIKEHEKCIMIFDIDPKLQKYSSKIITIEGYVVYFKL